MTLLSKIGAAILKGIGIVSGFLPLAQISLPGQSATITTVSNDLSEIAQIITSVEAAGQALQLKGPQKLQMAAPQVAQIILTSALLANHKISNETLFTGGAQKVADGMADILNSLNPDGVQVTNKS